MIIDHLGFHVSDFAMSRDFFTKALAPLGILIVKEGEGWAMYGRDGRGQLWIDSFGTPQGPMHVAFSADDRETVRLFHEKALAAGAKDNGAPGLRAQYHPNYFGAFVIGPDGHNIEAVCHSAE
jgi:catechol 2,3-dioxygenase-like lactoylglutathione lyase family enzyme